MRSHEMAENKGHLGKTNSRSNFPIHLPCGTLVAHVGILGFCSLYLCKAASKFLSNLGLGVLQGVNDGMF